jgi:Ala-tRNA(Pro) deacylase
MPATEQDLFTLLDRLGIRYTVHRHAPVFTVAESQSLYDLLPGGHVKNLFLKDKRGRYALVTALAAQKIDLNSLSRAAGVGLDRLSFASPDRLMVVLGVTPGAVTPLALMNAKGQELAVILDQGLMAHEVVYVHPLHNAASIGLAPDDLLAFIRHLGHEPVVLALDSL